MKGDGDDRRSIEEILTEARARLDRVGSHLLASPESVMGDHRCLARHPHGVRRCIEPPGLQDSLPTSRAGAQRGELDAHSGHPWLTIPNAISIVGLVSLTVALEVQVRFVEEPFVHDRPDRFDLIGASICLIGVGVIMPAPR